MLLPNTLLYHIFYTYLDSSVREQTWTLSRRWVNLWTARKLDYALRHHSSLRIRSIDFEAYPDVDSACLGELKLTDCINVHLMDWTLPSLTSLYLKDVKFGNEISGFENLKKLSVSGGFTHEIFTINCPNLESLTLGPDVSRCTLVVSAPNLSLFEFRSTDCVPSFSPGVVFPRITNVRIDIEIKDYDWASYSGDVIKLIMENFITMLNVVKGTQWLTLSRETIQVLRRIPNFSAYQPSPFGNLKFLYLLGILENATRSTDHVINYLLSNSPFAKVFQGSAYYLCDSRWHCETDVAAEK